jgi:hypothetical protein
MRAFLLSSLIAGFTAVASAQAQIPNFNDCRNEMRTRALTQDQRRAFMRACMARIHAACAEQVRQRQVYGDAGRELMRTCQGMPPRRRLPR